MLEKLHLPYRMVIRFLLLAGLSIVAVSGIIAAQSNSVSEGQQLFESKCLGCHTIGGGPLVGPDLKDVTTTRDHDWLVKWIANPTAMVDANDPTALALVKEYPALVMPSLGLSETEIDEILDYLASTSGTSTTGEPAAAATPALVGDVARGSELFTGKAKFANGGPSCIACHSVSGVGALGGGQLGPDLSNAVQTYGGEAGLNGFLSNPPTKTMNVIWSGNPITPQDRADLVAYLDNISLTGRPANAIVKLTALSIGGTALFLLAINFIWRNRLLGVRRPLVSGKRR